MRGQRRLFLAGLGLAISACTSGGGKTPGFAGQAGVNGTAGSAGGGSAGAGTSGGAGSTGGVNGSAGAGGGTAGTTLGNDAASGIGGLDASADMSQPDTSAADVVVVDAINGTPDGGAYNRSGWTAVSVPPYPTGKPAMNMNLQYSNIFDGNYNTRWSIGDTNSPAQTIGDEITIDMQEPHVFGKVMFWAGGENGQGGPDPRDYPGALDLAVSDDCKTFGAPIGMGTEPQPGCNSCTKPFIITLASKATARCFRLTLTKRLQLGGGIWWAISELFVYP